MKRQKEEGIGNWSKLGFLFFPTKSKESLLNISQVDLISQYVKGSWIVSSHDSVLTRLSCNVTDKQHRNKKKKTPFGPHAT